MRYTYEELITVLEDMHYEGLVVLPFGSAPLLNDDSWNTLVTESVWEATPWDEPHARGQSDPNASAKPGWAALEPRLAKAAEALESARILDDLDHQATHRINVITGADDYEHSIRRQVRGDVTPEQLAEKDRIRARYKTLVAGVADLTLAQKREFDPTADEHWRKPPAG